MEPFALFNKAQEYDEAQTLNVKQLAGVGTVTWNLQTHQNAEIVLTGNITMGPPLNWKKGRLVMVELIQDGTGGRTVAWASQFKDVTGLSLNSTANQSTVLVFKCIDNGAVMLISSKSCTRS